MGTWRNEIRAAWARQEAQLERIATKLEEGIEMTTNEEVLAKLEDTRTSAAGALEVARVAVTKLQELKDQVAELLTNATTLEAVQAGLQEIDASVDTAFTELHAATDTAPNPE